MKALKTLGNIRKKANDKGFTLVELIVVLVILAILAAILVPALLGYIDRAKGQQIVLNARSVYTAAQAELTSMYAKTTNTSAIPTLGTNEKESIRTTADVSATSATAIIGVKGDSGHNAFTVSQVIYTEDGKTVYFDGKSWEEVTSGSAPAITYSVGEVKLTEANN